MNSIGDDTTLAARVADYLSRQVGHRVTVGAIKRFPVGFSWLTFAVPVTGLEGAGDMQELILRLGPDYGLFAPYSAGPQVLAMRSLEGSSVPVPRAYWSSDDPSILGAPFMFCEKVSGGAVVPWVSAQEPGLDETYRRSLGRGLHRRARSAALHTMGREADRGHGAGHHAGERRTPQRRDCTSR